MEKMEEEGTLLTLPLDLSQPEVLSEKELICVLQERGLNTSGYDKKTKHELLTEYYRVACPLPQRKYRNNRRGRIMTKSQIHIAKRKRTFDQISDVQEGKSKSYTIASSTGNQEKEHNMPSSGLVTQFNFLSTSGDRIKPPPIVINPNKKIVKLGGGDKNESISLSHNMSPAINRQKITVGSSPKNTIVTKTQSNTKLDNIVINSQFKKKDITETSSVKAKDTVQQPQSGPKIKLKRSNEIKVDATEAIISNVCGGDNKNDNNEDYKHPTLLAEMDIGTKTRNNANVEGSKQRQLGLINSTLKKRAEHDVEHPFPGQKKLEKSLSPLGRKKTLMEVDEQEGEKDQEEEKEEKEVVAKKFKRIPIGWP